MEEEKRIAAILPKGFRVEVMEATQEVGVEEGTILSVRGTGVHEADKFFGISVREMLLVLVEVERVRDILGGMVGARRLDEPARGIGFRLSVDEIAEIVH